MEEARACLFGLRCTRDAGVHNILVEGDCLMLIQMLQINRFKIPVGFFVQDILAFALSFDFFFTVFCQEGGNRVAHDLAHLQPYSCSGRLWEGHVPEGIVSRTSNNMYEFINASII